MTSNKFTTNKTSTIIYRSSNVLSLTVTDKAKNCQQHRD